MPFEAYGAFFKPDELDVLNAAYEERPAWGFRRQLGRRARVHRQGCIF